MNTERLFEAPPNTSFERTRSTSSAKLRHRRARRSAQPLGGTSTMSRSQRQQSQDRATIKEIVAQFEAHPVRLSEREIESTLHANHDGQRVRVRGLFTGHAHGFFLRDEQCPGYMLSLKHADNGPDTSLCTPEKLVEVFGCPGGNDNGPIVTVSGILAPSKNPMYGQVLVDEMADFENVRTGERFNR